MKIFIFRLFPSNNILTILEKECYGHSMTRPKNRVLEVDPLQFTHDFMKLFKNPYMYLKNPDTVLKEYSIRFIKENLKECKFIYITHKGKYITKSVNIHLTRN